MVNYDPATLQLKIRKHFKEILSESAIIAIYLFGSSVKRHEKDPADIDIALLLDESAYKDDPVASLAPAYMAATRAALDLECETDITILNTASLEMAYTIITSGVCLVETDREKRLGFEIALKGMYFDFKPFLDQLRSECINAL